MKAQSRLRGCTCSTEPMIFVKVKSTLLTWVDSNCLLQMLQTEQDSSENSSDGNEMSLVMRNPVYAICEQQRRRSAYASAQSDQHFIIRCLDSIISVVSISKFSRL